MGVERIVVFDRDDEGYEAWVAANWGYVLIRRAAGEYMLHVSDCGHLEHNSDGSGFLTRKPRRWAPLKYDLIDWCKSQTGGEPLACSDCM